MTLFVQVCVGIPVLKVHPRLSFWQPFAGQQQDLDVRINKHPGWKVSQSYG